MTVSSIEALVANPSISQIKFDPPLASEIDSFAHTGKLLFPGAKSVIVGSGEIVIFPVTDC